MSLPDNQQRVDEANAKYAKLCQALGNKGCTCVDSCKFNHTPAVVCLFK